MGAVLADPLAQALVAAVGILLVVIAARDRILLHLDAWILPETADQRQALADAAGALAQAERITTVGETVTRTVRRGCGSPATLLVADDAETRAGGFSAPQARFVPLPRQAAIVHLLETAGGPVRVEPAGRPSVFPLLPPDEAAWVTETGADVIVPVPGPGTDVLGVLVVGRRLDGPPGPLGRPAVPGGARRGRRVDRWRASSCSTRRAQGRGRRRRPRSVPSADL